MSIPSFPNSFKANGLAVTLQRDYGIVSGDIVPVFVDQTPGLLVAVIGILKAGADYPIPRDSSWPLGVSLK
jgi:non-ribosomal peptide synthetase component F